jgi:hypothetical protein
MSGRVFIALFVLAVGLPVSSIGSAQQAAEKVIPAINKIQPWQQVGQQPYEMTWVQRRQNPHTLLDFENMEGWTLELFDGARGELRRSREQQMWGEHVCKFLYAGTNPQSHVIARPPKPIPIPGKFDSIDLWGYGDRWSWVPDPTTPPVDVSILVRDARNKEFKVELTAVNWKQWWLIHRRIPPKVLSEMVMPVSFSGIEISKVTNRDLRYFYCDSLAFFEEGLGPLKLQAEPKRNLIPYRGEIVGLNTGPGTLPFPTREQTILPTNFEKNFKVSVREMAKNEFEFRYVGQDATVVYEYKPALGILSEITVRVDGGRDFHPLDGGGVRFTDTPEGQTAKGTLLEAKLTGDGVHAKFRMGSHIVDYALRLWQKSLVLDVWCDGGDATGLSFGKVSGVINPRLITVPYITYGSTNPRVLVFGAPANPTFTSVWFDWYRSNASEPYYTRNPPVTKESAEINGGMRYLPKTDGLRNNLYERIFITNSPIYAETLPTIANPPSIRQYGDQYVWTVTEPESWEKDHERSAQIRSYGLEMIMQHSHEVTWRDEGDCNTEKLHAAPQKGGDAMLKWYIEAQNAMGWLQGVYTNYTDFCTLNTNWSPDFVQREPDGEWRRAWPRNYALKPSKAVEFDKYYAKRIKEKFGVKMSYTDVHTANAPWRYCDYDARVPGAGTFAATFYAYGQLLRNDQKVYGPTESEGTYEWLYAGLDSGNYGWVYTDVNLLTSPLDVSFRLRKIHPLECDYGMGDADYYLSRLDTHWTESPKRSQYVDLFLATTIAYGNMGWLVKEINPSEPFGIEAMTRSYYMMQQLQQQYAFCPPKLIQYTGLSGKWYTPSQALSSGAIADSLLHVVYENGTEVYVNRSTHGTWTVTGAGTPVTLPVSGWLAFNPSNHFYEMSALENNHRIDYVDAPGYEYLDGRGQWTERGNLGVTGGVVLRRTPGGLLELIDIYGNGRIAFRASTGGVLMAYDPDGKNLGEVKLVSSRAGWKEFNPLRGGRKYVFAPSK